MNITLVPSEHFNDTWPLVVDMVGKAVARTGGRYHVVDVYTDIMMGKQTLWLAFDDDKKIVGCVVIGIHEYPMMRVCRLEYLAGEDMHSWLSAGFPVITKYAKELKCSRLEMSARPGLGKAIESFGGKLMTVEYEFNLED